MVFYNGENLRTKSNQIPDLRPPEELFLGKSKLLSFGER